MCPTRRLFFDGAKRLKLDMASLEEHLFGGSLVRSALILGRLRVTVAQITALFVLAVLPILHLLLELIRMLLHLFLI